MKFNLKKTLATVSALCLTASLMVPMGADAGQMLGQLNFDDGVGLPWHVCESATASLDFDIEGGTYNITIVAPGGLANGGEDRWDCQFRHRGLKMRASDSYTLSFELTASNSGMFYTKIGNLNGDIEVWHNGSTSSSDFGQYWNCIQVTAGQKYTMTCTFTPTQDVDVAEWTFQFGGAGQYTPQDCFPTGTVLTFDNMSLINNSRNDDDWVDEEEQVFNNISLNQVGYYANRDKKATIVTDTGNLPFEVKDSSGTVVYSGTTGAAKYDEDSGNTVAIADFSEVRDAGTYTVECDGNTSYSFEILDSNGGVYQDLTQDALNYFFLNRGNQNTSAEYISGGYADSTVLDKNNKVIYNSAEEHTEALTITGSKVRTKDTATIVNEWRDDYLFDGSDLPSGTEIDVTGGWYDAGDYGKYVVNGGISVWTLQNIYERAMANGDTSKWSDSNTDIMYIPETGNGTPDILDEAAVELDWFVDCMQRSDGMVYHKTHDYKWTALATLPSQDVGPDGKTQLKRIVKPVTYAATLNLAATGAQGYRVWKDIDATRAQKYLDAAVKAYDAAKSLYASGATTDSSTGASLYAPLDQSVGGGPYGDTEVSDDFYWAACELFAATGDSKYETDLKSYKEALEVVTSLDGGENSGSFSSFNWGCTASLGTLSLALNTQGTVSDADVATCKSSVVSAAQTYVNKEDEQGYGLPYQQATYDPGDGSSLTGYEWGSNSFVVNNAIVMAYAYDFTGDGDYVDGVTSAMDYILGRNPMENSYVTGYGDHYTKFVHHRYWSYLLDPEFPLAPAGVLAGGPNSGMQDPYIKGAGYKVGTLSPQKCYLDHIEAWSANECTINWNSPLAWVVSFMEDEYDAPVGDDTLSDYDASTDPSEGGTTTTPTESLKTDVTKVTLEEGESQTVKVTSGTVAEWTSSDESVATVDSNGKITAVSKGSATVTAKDANGKTVAIAVTVNEAETSVTTTTTSTSTTTTTTTSGTTTTTSGSDSSSDRVWGDANCDTNVRVNDIQLIRKYVLHEVEKGSEEYTTEGFLNSDVTHDDVVRVNDIQKIRQYVLHIIEASELGK
jgi:endoglucanase